MASAELTSIRRSPALNVLAVIGWLMAGALLVPAIYGLLTAAPDFVRYMKIRSM